MLRAMTSILAGCCWTVVVVEDLRVFPVLLGLVLLYDTKRVLASLAQDDLTSKLECFSG